MISDSGINRQPGQKGANDVRQGYFVTMLGIMAVAGELADLINLPFPTTPLIQQVAAASSPPSPSSFSAKQWRISKFSR